MACVEIVAKGNCCPSVSIVLRLAVRGAGHEGWRKSEATAHVRDARCILPCVTLIAGKRSCHNEQFVA